MEERIDWYLDFIDLNYKPSKTDIIAYFYVEPAENISMEEAAGRVASESSVGTWTTLTKLPERVKKLMARVYEINGNIIKIAYPIDLWELGSIPQLLSGVAGNIFGMKAVKNLRLLDIILPEIYVKHFMGPEHGIDGVRSLFKIYNRPITATVPKPKVGYDSDEYAEVSYEILSGGIDFIKDDENLASLSFNKFEDRAKNVLRIREKVEDETGERKGYLANITAPIKEMEKRAKLISDLGGEYVMIDIITAGWAALQHMREVCHDLKLAIHAHRAMHASFTRNKKHGIRMYVVAKLARLIGVDNIHTGAIYGKLEGPAKDVLEINKFLYSDWYHIKKTFPVASGGLHPGLLPKVIETNGSVDLFIQVGGGVLGHPMGARAGAKAVRDAIDAYLNGISLEDAARKSKELQEALRKWHYIIPV